jgi:DNA-binding NtrC family response regulator
MAPGPVFDDATATMVRERPRPLAAVLRVLDVPAEPPRFELRAGACILGTGRDCQIVLVAATVSRRHAEVSLVPEGVLVRDLGSRNGVRYLGQSVDHIVLGFGGRVQLGEATLGIEVDHGALDAELQPYAGESYRGILGRSLGMRQLFAKLERLEGSLVTVLVQGESGVGKELVAQALHQGSSVAAGPFVAVNCGAVARELVASELFGHQRGAFTGAHETRQGAFERADGGTLFLDELGELPLEIQPMLLRVLETGELQAVGSDRSKRVKVRVVAATNRDLGDEVAAGRFRQDLFYRLAVVTLRVPPLRERPEDIEPIARAFAEAHGIGALPSPLVGRLRARTWQGNVRELRNAILAYAALGVLPEPAAAGAPALLDAGLMGLVDVHRPYAEQKDALIDRFTRHYLEALLADTQGNQTLAASRAGVTRTYLGRMLDKHGVTKGRR